MYHVYILWSDQGRRFYVGLSQDIAHRLAQHNAGDSRWTARFAGSWRVVWSQACASLTEARALESKLKRQNGGHGLFHLTGLNPAQFPRSSGS